nr:MAG TPA: Lysis protein [Microviridae sp.]
MREFLVKLLEVCRSKYGLAVSAILLAVLYVVLSGCSVTKNQTITDGSTLTENRCLQLSGPEKELTPTFPESMTENTAE